MGEFGIILLVLLLIGIILSQSREDNHLLNQDISKYVRGVMAVIIVIHHLALGFGEYIADSVINFFFISYVGIFYLLSGYGLSYSFANKKHYLDGFIGKRFIKLIIPFLVALTIRIIYEWFKFGLSFNIAFDTFNEIGWFVKSIIVIYLAWYTLASLKIKFWSYGNSLFLFFMTILLVLYTTICILLHLSSVWYGDIFCFVLGMYIFYNKEFIIQLFKDKYLQIIIVCLFVIFLKWIYTYHLYSKINVFGFGTILIFSSSLSFCILICIFSMKFSIKNNIIGRFFLYIGAISYETYILGDTRIIFIDLMNMFSIPLYISYILCFLAILMMGALTHGIIKNSLYHNN